MKKKTIRIMALMSFLLAVVIAWHQYATWGTVFELSDVHHETFVVAFAVAGITFLYMAAKWRRR